jgi:hypothetical protein
MVVSSGAQKSLPEETWGQGQEKVKSFIAVLKPFDKTAQTAIAYNNQYHLEFQERGPGRMPQ